MAAMTLMQRAARTCRHAMTGQSVGRRAFPTPALAAIGAAIGEGERQHRAELRLVVEAALPATLAWRGVSNRERALALFIEYGVWDTEENCGVMVYVNLAERKVDIVADRHIDRKIDAATWQGVCNTMTSGFARGNYQDSTIKAIAQINALLVRHFPATGERPNELPDQPVMR
jgi:uncharacterized membrane protein